MYFGEIPSPSVRHQWDESGEENVWVCQVCGEMRHRDCAYSGHDWSKQKNEAVGTITTFRFGMVCGKCIDAKTGDKLISGKHACNKCRNYFIIKGEAMCDAEAFIEKNFNYIQGRPTALYCDELRSGNTCHNYDATCSAADDRREEHETDEQGRDVRRLFSTKQKVAARDNQKSKCANCKCSLLQQAWEAHHKIRWADGGMTDEENCVVLCKPCHDQVHNEHWVE